VIARARPLLGTLVSIRAEAPDEALHAAFAAVQQVHTLMNFHSDQGDVARIHSEAHRRPVRVHPWTFAVLLHAKRISAASDGAFDVTLGRGGLSFDDIVLMPGNRVGMRRRARLDLGGIAKGFAVDRAVAALRRAGVTDGCVNAGGDLRVFGHASQALRVRLPGRPQWTLPLAAARNAAFATSGGYFGSVLLDPRTRRQLCTQTSITVRARTCMLADALAKAVAARGPQPQLLRRFRANAYLLEGDQLFHASRR
jgi:FAD:protein FMN transferase